MIESKTTTYLGMLLSAFLLGKIMVPTMIISPYMIFLAIFTGYWGWAKTFMVHFCMFVVNESTSASSIMPILQSYWSMAYLAYFMFTLVQVYVIKAYLINRKKLINMIHL